MKKIRCLLIVCFLFLFHIIFPLPLSLLPFFLGDFLCYTSIFNVVYYRQSTFPATITQDTNVKQQYIKYDQEEEKHRPSL